jgi:hypothetical protein
MAREIFNPNLALFVSVPEGGTTFQPNPNSIVQNDTGVSHLEFFKFVGRVVGKALYDGQLMDAYFTRSFYKHMLGQPLTYEVRQRAGQILGVRLAGGPCLQQGRLSTHTCLITSRARLCLCAGLTHSRPPHTPPSPQLSVHTGH